jgi:hypothetical protein
MRGDVLHRGGERGILLRGARRRHLLLDQRHGVVLQQAGRLSFRIADDLAALDRWRVARDAGGPQRRRVRQRHVTVETVDPDRVIRRHGVDPVPARRLAAPERVIPVAAGDPRAGRRLFGLRARHAASTPGPIAPFRRVDKRPLRRLC